MPDSAAETATSRLRAEHQHILEVANALAVLVRAADEGRWDVDAFADCVTFIRLFADACHHGKEEDLLFPELISRGMRKDAGPIAVMLHEHAEGRRFARTMAAELPGARDGDAEALGRLERAGRGYVALIRGHIMKEDNILFNMADQIIDAPACRSLCAAYDGVCQRRFDGCTVAELESILARLVERYPSV